MTPHLEITAVTSKNTDTLESIFKQLCNKYLQKKKRSSNGFFFTTILILLSVITSLK